MKKIIIVGCGLFGAVCGRLLAERGYEVTILEKESHIGGLTYDYRYQNTNILVHKYGPHILNLNHSEVYNFLKKYDKLIPVDVKRKVFVNNKMIPLPVNLESIKIMIGEQDFPVLREKLSQCFEKDEVMLGELMACADAEIRNLGKLIYDKVYLGYNLKMWGKRPEDVNSTILQRLPIRLTYNERLTECKYQVVPEEGYYSLFQKILAHDNIEVKTGIDGTKCIRIWGKSIYYKEKRYEDIMIYTGPIDELFNYKFGNLQYRSIYFRNQLKKKYIDESAAVITYPNNYIKTRTTDMGMLLNQKENVTVCVSEYPGAYKKENHKFGKPSYPVNDEQDEQKLVKYKKKVTLIENLYLGGRLGEYKYYNMEETILSAMKCVEEICRKYGKAEL